MVVWQGLGLLGLLIPGVLYNLAKYFSDAAYGADYRRTHSWPVAAALLLSAVLVGWLGLALNSYSKKIVEPKSGWERICRGRHTLFGIPLQYVAVLLVGVAAYVTVATPGR